MRNGNSQTDAVTVGMSECEFLSLAFKISGYLSVALCYHTQSQRAREFVRRRLIGGVKATNNFKLTAQVQKIEGVPQDLTVTRDKACAHFQGKRSESFNNFSVTGQ